MSEIKIISSTEIKTVPLEMEVPVQMFQTTDGKKFKIEADARQYQDHLDKEQEKIIQQNIIIKKYKFQDCDISIMDDGRDIQGRYMIYIDHDYSDKWFNSAGKEIHCLFPYHITFGNVKGLKAGWNLILVINEDDYDRDPDDPYIVAFYSMNEVKEKLKESFEKQTNEINKFK